jgi:hypothetical protein
MRRNEPNLTEEQWAELQNRRSRPLPPLFGLPAHPDIDLPATVPYMGIDRANYVKSKKSRMNKWETEYSYELEARKQAGKILWWGYEAITLRLADGCRYTPDFAVMAIDSVGEYSSGITSLQFVEIKGWLRDDANIKFKMAGELFPFEFFMYRKRLARLGGGWELIKHLNGGR